MKTITLELPEETNMAYALTWVRLFNQTQRKTQYGPVNRVRNVENGMTIDVRRAYASEDNNDA